MDHNADKETTPEPARRVPWPFRIHPLGHPIFLGLVTALLLLYLLMASFRAPEDTSYAAGRLEGDLYIFASERLPAGRSGDDAEASPVPGKWRVSRWDAPDDHLTTGERFAPLAAFGTRRVAVIGPSLVEEFDLLGEEVERKRRDESFADLGLEPKAATYGEGGLVIAGIRDRDLLIVRDSFGGLLARTLTTLDEDASLRKVAISVTGAETTLVWTEKREAGHYLRSLVLEGTESRTLFSDHLLGKDRIPTAIAMKVSEGQGTIGLIRRHRGSDSPGLRIHHLEIRAGVLEASSSQADTLLSEDPGAGVAVMGGGDILVTEDDTFRVWRDGSELETAPTGGSSLPLELFFQWAVYGPALLALLFGIWQAWRTPGLPALIVVLPPAPLWRRISAFFVDFLLAQAIAGVLLWMFEDGREVLTRLFHSEAETASSAALSADVLIFGIVTYPILLLGGALFEWRSGATPGKWLLDLRVASEDGRGSPGLWRVVARRAMLTIDLGFFTAIFVMLGARRQRLGDIVARMVVRRRL